MGIILLLNFHLKFIQGTYVYPFSHLRRFIQHFQTAILERELIAACSRTAGSLGLRHGLRAGLRNGLRSALPPALDAAEGLFLATIFSTFFWSLLIFTISRWH
jgi:hypothetical protein